MDFHVSTDSDQNPNLHLWVMESGAVSLIFLICEMRIIKVPALWYYLEYHEVLMH